MKKIFSIFTALSAIIVTSTLMQSCSDNENGGKVTNSTVFQSTSLMMGTGNGVNDYTLSNAPQIIFREELDLGTLEGTVDYQFLGLQTTMGSINFSTGPVPYVRNTQNGTFTANVASIDAGAVTLTGFSYYCYGLWWYISFTLDNVKYMICPVATYSFTPSGSTAKSDVVLFEGDTKITGVAQDPNGYENDDIMYGYKFNAAKGQVDIHMYGVKFASNMPPQSELVIPGANFVMGANGIKIFSDDSIYPTSDGTPYPQFVINNLNSVLTYIGLNGTLSFDCSQANWHVSVSDMEIATLNSN